MDRITGLIAATYTPMHDDGTLRLQGIPAIVAHLERAGNTGLYVCGSTGEGMSLTGAERRQVAEAYTTAAKELNPQMTVVVQVGHNSLAEARELAAHAQQIGADVVSATCPSYFKVSTVDDLVASMAEVAKGAPDLPFYYYHIPALTGSTISMAAFLQAAAVRIPNLAGVKYTAPNTDEFQACLALDGGRFDLLWGCDEMMLPALAVGARGFVGSTYNVFAPMYLDLIAAFERGDLEEAQRLQLRAVAFIDTIKRWPFHSAMKAILSMLDLPCGACRLPQRPLSSEQTDQLREQLTSIGAFEVDHAASLNR